MESPAQDEFADLRKLVAEPRWLLEGNYAGTLPIRLAEADTAIFLDLHAITCLTGILQRRWRHRGGQHQDGVYDRITWNFVRYIWGYRKTMRPKVRRLLQEHGDGAISVAAGDEASLAIRVPRAGIIRQVESAAAIATTVLGSTRSWVSASRLPGVRGLRG